jgi:hypothetical protein
MSIKDQELRYKNAHANNGFIQANAVVTIPIAKVMIERRITNPLWVLLFVRRWILEFR